MKNKKRLLIIAIIFLVILVPLIWLLAWGNKAIALTEYTVQSDSLPESFNGFRILQVSDLHNDEFGENNEKLLSMMEKAEADIIVITGDTIDSYGTEVEIAKSFLEKASEIAPCYYVTGNHEGRLPSAFEELSEYIEELGITVLRGQSVTIEKGSDTINIMGIDDPNFGRSVKDSLSEGLPDGYTVLLSHRPENFKEYVDAGVDLVFCGHAHGGQFILPFIGGVYAPGQGLDPQYFSGIHTEKNTSMIVSRGLGNSVFPLRINNRPELVVVELWCEE